jgi:membrane dipeptidase
MKKKVATAKTEDLFIFDAHCDTASYLADQPWTFRESPAHLDLKKIRRGGLKSQVFAIWVDPLFAPKHEALKKGLEVLRAMEQKVFALKLAAKVTTVAEMENAVNKGKLAAWLFLEGGHIIENSPEVLAVFHSLGVRGMTLTHSQNTDWADSSTDAPHARGLTALGKRIVFQMECSGMAIDVSHASDPTIRDVLQTSVGPVMASHSNARKLCAVPRNLSDALIRAIAGRRGFIGVNFFPAFVKRRVFEQIEANFKKYEKEIRAKVKNRRDDAAFMSQVEWDYYVLAAARADTVDLDDVIDHIVHIATVGGIGCVGLGSDFDGIPCTPVGLADAAAFPALAAGMRKRGLSQSEIRRVCGLNLKDFMRRVEKRGRKG